ncbi:VRR-NUC domain-containing protein [Ruminococcus sp. XPD3002]|uniref:VRR-NUC domain-containing protein n=1 Tax=Ruminococcus sp. XPD3002 TaxID=1452269 RepID=UPI00091CED9D|nr:VRR-NUC domain-containing protein [Ruminococcus flavefaciens]
MREKTVESKFTSAVKAKGGLAVKFTSPGFNGMPDRLVMFPGGRIAFVEVKAPGETPRPLQRSRHRLLRRMGFKVYVLESIDQIGGIIDGIQAP